MEHALTQTYFFLNAKSLNFNSLVNFKGMNLCQILVIL